MVSPNPLHQDSDAAASFEPHLVLDAEAKDKPTIR